jgi:hypothetical protein
VVAEHRHFANSGLGISLGDDCVIEAGLYLTAGTIVTLPDALRVMARDLNGQSGLLFRRNSITGSVEAITRQASGAAAAPTSTRASRAGTGQTPRSELTNKLACPSAKCSACSLADVA